MKLLALALLVLSNTVCAQTGWTLVYHHNQIAAMADFASIRQEGDTVTMWTRWSYESDDGGWSKDKFEFDCDGERTRILFTEGRFQRRLAPVITFNPNPQAWTRVPPKSAVEVLFKIACGKR